MSAFWLKICTILCLCYITEMKEVVWREVGESVTIQCRRSTASGPHSLYLKRGLREEETIAKIQKPGRKPSSFPVSSYRVEYSGTFPNIDFSLKNLSVNDTGPYWCLYSKQDARYNPQYTKGEGSVILVVKENDCARVEAVHDYDEPNLNMPMVYAVLVAALLLIIILCFIIWTKRRTKSSDITVEQTSVATRIHVYEGKECVEAEDEAEEEAVSV